jgi:histone H3/H4
MAKKAPAKAKGKKPVEKEQLIVASKVKNAIRGFDLNVASDAAGALNEVVYWYIEQAAKRAQANGRKTVRPYDFVV